MNRRKQRKISAFLDAKLPLVGASHADVERYWVDTPLRYTQCFAMLTDGRTVRLQDASQFVGWSGKESECSLMFSCEGRRIVINRVNGCNELEDSSMRIGVRKFISRDGGLIIGRHRGSQLARTAAERMHIFAPPAFERTGATI